MIKCKFCNNQMLEKHLDDHVQRKHEPAKMVECPHCLNPMPQESLDKHIQRKHALAGSLKDILSGCVVKSVTVLNETQVELKQKLVECSHCHSTMPEESLDDHVQRNHANVECEYCNHTMPQSSLNAHIKRKHADVLNMELTTSRASVPMTTTTTKTKKLNDAPPQVSTVHKSTEVINQCSGTHEHCGACLNGETEEYFYFIRVSEKELKKFLQSNRIYPREGHLCLKDS